MTRHMLVVVYMMHLASWSLSRFAVFFWNDKDRCEYVNKHNLDLLLSG